MWKSKSKHDLIIEVWEKLDCESIGRAEIEAIEIVVAKNYGDSPQDTPMKLARLLADEGAELRHSEILELDVERRTSVSELPVLSRPLDLSTRTLAAQTIAELEEARLKFQKNEKSNEIKALRRKAINARDRCRGQVENPNKSDSAKSEALEISEWLSIWIQSPDIFSSWFKAKYPNGIEKTEDS